MEDGNLDRIRNDACEFCRYADAIVSVNVCAVVVRWYVTTSWVNVCIFGCSRSCGP